MDFYDREMKTYNHFTKSPDPNINSAAYVSKRGDQFWVIQFATSSLYLNMITNRRPNRRVGKMAPPHVPTAARYCRVKNIVLSYLFASVEINTQLRIFENIS